MRIWGFRMRCESGPCHFHTHWAWESVFFIHTLWAGQEVRDKFWEKLAFHFCNTSWPSINTASMYPELCFSQFLPALNKNEEVACAQGETTPYPHWLLLHLPAPIGSWNSVTRHFPPFGHLVVLLFQALEILKLSFRWDRLWLSPPTLRKESK